MKKMNEDEQHIESAANLQDILDRIKEKLDTMLKIIEEHDEKPKE